MARGGYTGVALSRAAGITPSHISQLINGRRQTVLPTTAKRICDALGCNFDDVFEIRGAENEQG